jgi:hypothetical protein
MNGLKCPKCKLVNLLNATVCHRCGTSFGGLEEKAAVSVPVEQTFQAQGFSLQNESRIDPDNETGRKTHFWYRMLCSAMFLLYSLVAALGVFLLFFADTGISASEQEDALMAGVIYAFLGFLLGTFYLICILLPRRPFNWIVGFIAIGISMTSCCTWPATIPLLIYWIKPETQAYLRRS